jgi:hypothetical protein
MIVIPPTDSSLKYFTTLAKDSWTNYTLRDLDIQDSLEKEGKTLIISCDLIEDKEVIQIKLHYRFLKGELYCFVEEA